MSLRLISIASALVGVASLANAGVTQVSLALGEAGSPGCTGPNDPPTLDDGVTRATATFDLSYDDATGVLTLVAHNTSPVVPGVPNPLLRELYLNLPHGTVSGVSLLLQSTGADPQPAFALSVDADNHDDQDAIKLGCFGRFGLRLDGWRVANPAADTIDAPAGAWSVGPVTFQLQLQGPGVAGLTASSFAAAYSFNPPGDVQTNVAAKFISGGPLGASGQFTTVPSCTPGAWYTGTPSLGNVLTFTMSSAPGCNGCLLTSLNPGPTAIGPYLVPLGLPAFVIIPDTLLGVDTFVTRDVAIPDEIALVGTTFYLMVATFDGSAFRFSDQFSITIQP